MIKSLLCAFIFTIIFFSTYANTSDIKTYKFIFAKNEDFKVDFADYPKGQEAFYELNYETNAALPH